ncbi:hypothetical protein JCM9279_002619 [Rhodotorula babjevae]
MTSRALLLGSAGALILFARPVSTHLNTFVKHEGASSWLVGTVIALVVILAFAAEALVACQFAWNCFVKPLGKNATQEGRLNRFYEGQAAIYDKTRSRLLQGRTTMLKLSAAHLREQRRREPNKRLVWLDIGGGTGWNVEEMDKYFPISSFDAVYVLDLCGPLLEVSRKRFAARGWDNVHCLLQDATHFALPTWNEQEGLDGETGGLDYVTLSYSLSMMPDPMNLLDRIDRTLSPSGLLAVADFYVSAREPTSVAGVIGDVGSRQCSWWTRTFWLNWFSFDHVDLHPSRRHYLEHRFATIKSFNGRNAFIPLITSIPYYVSLHTSRRIDTSRANQAYEVDAGNTISASPSPLLMPTLGRRHSNDIPDLALGVSAALSRSRSTTSVKKLRRSGSSASEQSDSCRIDISPELQLSSFHFGWRHHRVPYVADVVHREFRSWIYSFAWEDPRVDVEHIKLTKEDEVLCITSGGENAMHYAIDAAPRRIHSCDLNPAQGHLLELKLAGIMALDYDDYWKMWGEGRHPDFRELLDSKLSPFLTSHAFQFWRQNDHVFDKNFYYHGYSGHALRLANWALWLAGVHNSTAKMCAATDLDEQRRLWKTKIRPVLLSSTLTKLFFSNPLFLWNALGVPMNQARTFLAETTVAQFATDTFDPVALNTSVATDNYFYQLCLQGRYTRSSCPEFLTRSGFDKLKKDNAAALDCMRIHTDSIANVMRRLGSDSLTVAIIMDLQDWFPNTVDAPPPSPSDKPCELTSTIRTLHTALKPGGRVFFRSAAQVPWYLALYRREGFKVECIHKREIGGRLPICRVNMYASFYKCTKL